MQNRYYPFGLQMSGISDKAINKLNNQTKFNGGVELEEDYGVNLYSTFYRQYDPQLGRFGGVDILGAETPGLSAYQFSRNNPVSFNDPMGDKYQDPSGETWHHADGLAGTLAEGRGYQAGFGWDGFGGGYGGVGGEGRGIGNGSFDYKFSQLIARLKVDNGVTRYNYTNYSNSFAYETHTDKGEQFFDNTENEEVYFTGISEHYEAVESMQSESADGWEIAGKLTEVTDFSLTITERTVVGAQRLANKYGGTASEILEGGNTLKGVGYGLVGISAIITVANAESKYGHLRTSDKADLIIDAALVATEVATTILEVSNPVGWIVGGSLFIGNLISEHYYNESLTEHLFNH